ncbi:MAG: Formate hydrogenlyase subunit 4 [Planctomycetes bacterium ADurb.Bin126]|nr:MAG: Formate hydrogenlyase subunit 4 [Planctomycetes bacterium ADurb.Bin126]HOD82453.1 NADH-quinone oxidoreductase subunit H [Phycisphaerae bacterium]HQL76189.1 NADH-quinone oxidoreductase subunit H [Phycisphaerae bacterium]
MTTIVSILHVILALAMSPLLIGVINRVKAGFAGRQGQPLFQPYFDLAKLLRKGAVYSRTTTWIFRAAPVVGLAGAMVAVVLVPLGGLPGLLAFPGDLVVLAYVLGTTRFMTVLAALDTGSAFEGMGASREVQFSLLAEPVLLLSLAALGVCTRSLALSDIYAGLFAGGAGGVAATAAMVAAALLLVLLAENARIPVDDPNTHLELTMIHEVMVLDHGGVDLACIQYGAGVKLWVFSALLVGAAAPCRTGVAFADLALGVGGVFAVAVVVGVVESCMARLRLVRVPQMLVVGGVLAIAALLWALR